MVSKKAVNMMLASAVALTVAGGIGSAEAMKEGKEKCYGVVKAGHNDCGSADKSHSCAGHATVDSNSNEWVALPTGTCDKLAGGSLTAGGDHSAVDAVMEHGEKMMKDHH